MDKIPEELFVDLTNRTRIILLLDVIKKLYPGSKYKELQKAEEFFWDWLSELNQKYDSFDPKPRNE